MQEPGWRRGPAGGLPAPLGRGDYQSSFPAKIESSPPPPVSLSLAGSPVSVFWEPCFLSPGTRQAVTKEILAESHSGTLSDPGLGRTDLSRGQLPGLRAGGDIS